MKCTGDEVHLPPWLDTLLSQVVHAAKVKISKYNYGCAMLSPHLCRTLPNWIGFVQSPFLGVDFNVLPSLPVDLDDNKPKEDVITLDGYV